ncbi:MAG TPA: GNAT family N-acetyltransferase [Caldilineaceae bacterium]|nr:GNAT family N-acetyltransferase [Caldilineaceae bacterium]
MAVIREAPKEEYPRLIPLLLLAEPSEGALRWSLARLSDAVYCMEEEGQLVGAATMRWRSDPCEIVELAIAPERQRQGLGRQLVAWLIAEAQRRGHSAIIVGASNASIGNIVFYQRCGFRMDHVRRDYFWYYDQPRSENGIPVRDLLVFRYDIGEDASEKQA